MFLPFHYALRNLSRDPSRSVQTVAGSALVVFLVMGAHALNHSMSASLKSSGSIDNVLFLSAGSEESLQRSEISEEASGIATSTIRGIYQQMGMIAASPEAVNMSYLEVPEVGRVRGMLRGITPSAFLTHTGILLEKGTFPGPGEILVGRLAWKAFGVPQESFEVGNSVDVDGVPLTISGQFASPGSVKESEIWMELNELRTLAQRDSISTLVLRLGSAQPDDVDLFAKQRLDLELVAMKETDYYQKLNAFHAPVRSMVWITAAMIALSAVFGGLNTLYAAFASRVRELATLQALGFRPIAILVSLIQESLLTSLIGTLIGALTATLLLSGRAIVLSAGAFTLRMDPQTLQIGLVTGISLGLLGALPPALRCLGIPLPRALRDSA